MATYYINADTGNDTTGDGSIGNPWLTIAKAYTSSSTGDTIVLQDATAHYTVSSATRAGRTYEGESDDASGAVIDGGGTQVSFTLTGYDTTYRNITFTNFLNTTACIFIIASLNVFTFENCVFRDLQFAASYTFGLFGNSNGTTPWGTLNLVNCLFDNCYTAAVPTNGPFVGFRSSTSSTTLYVTGCTVYIPVPPSGKYAPDCFDSSNPGYGTQNKHYKNTIFENVGGGTFNIESALCYGNTAFTLRHCCRHNVGVGGHPSYPAAAPTDTTGTITSDPLLIDPANDNFNLQEASPCMDTGTLV